MADIITQLQDRLDQLNTQLYASLRYISTHHSTSPLPPSTLPHAPPQQQQQEQQQHQQNNHISSSSFASFPSAAEALPNGQNPAVPTTTTTTTLTAHQSPAPAEQQQQQQQQDSQPSFKITDLDPEQRPDSPATFAAAQRELAHDLVVKTGQIEELVRGIVGVERDREEQERRIGVLEGELQGAIGERERVERERGEWVERVQGLICSVRR